MTDPRGLHASGKKKLLDTPVSIWKAVTESGGLDLRFHGDMDEDITESLLRALGADPSGQLASVLADPDLTVERFIGALLEALNPFSTMLSDLLAMFEKAGATRADHALKIDFDFGNAPKLSFDLRQFREWMESVQRVRELVAVRRWSYTDLWDLSRVLRFEANSRPPTPAGSWLLEYYEMRRWPDFELPRAVSGDAVLDAALSKCFNVWSMVVHETSKFGRGRNELHERGLRMQGANEGEGEWSMRFLAQVDHDNWAGSVAAGMHDVALRASSLSEPERRAFVGDRLRGIEELFSRVPRMTIEEEQTRRVLLEFLNLPIWQRRHELYSAWIMTLIADALQGHELRFHHDAGTLSFSFGGSHLATAEATLPHLHVWAELRSPLVEPSAFSGRKRIQPDYTLVTDPVTSPNSAVVVVECKQYRRFSKSNFSRAVIDYATGRPNAKIVLAAYGPVRDDFLRNLSPALADRITLLGHLRPGGDDARVRFRQTVQQAIANRFPDSSAVPEGHRIPVRRVATDALKSIRLTWRAAPRDLDLHLAVLHGGIWSSVDFRSRGSRADFPWAELDHDVTVGFGPETVTIVKLLEATYRCYVENYSREASLANSGAEIVIELRDSEIRLTCPRTGSGRFWQVFDFDVAGKLLVINEITEVEPTAILATHLNQAAVM